MNIGDDVRSILNILDSKSGGHCCKVMVISLSYIISKIEAIDKEEAIDEIAMCAKDVIKKMRFPAVTAESELH